MVISALLAQPDETAMAGMPTVVDQVAVSPFRGEPLFASSPRQ